MLNLQAIAVEIAQKHGADFAAMTNKQQDDVVLLKAKELGASGDEAFEVVERVRKYLSTWGV
jgi:hypothetical protein